MSATTEFIDSMLRLRDQKLRAQLAQDEAMAQMGAALGAGISSAGGSIAKGIQAGQENKIYNQGMNAMVNMQNPPRAAAVNPNAPGVATAVANYGGPTQPFTGSTGGKAAFDMQMKMQDQMAQRMNESLSHEASTQRLYNAQTGLDLREQSAALAREREDRLRQEQRTRELMDAYSGASKQYQEASKNAIAYNKGTSTFLADLAEAQAKGDVDKYNAASEALKANHMAGKKMGLITEMPTIPDFVTEEQRSAIERQKATVSGLETKLKAAQGDYIPTWLGGQEKNYEQQLLEQQKALQELPGYQQSQTGYALPRQPESIMAEIPEAPSPENFLNPPAATTRTGQAAPSGATGTGTTTSTVAPSQGTIPLSEAKKYDPKASVGGYLQDAKGNRLFITQ